MINDYVNRRPRRQNRVGAICIGVLLGLAVVWAWLLIVIHGQKPTPTPVGPQCREVKIELPANACWERE